MSTEKYLTYRGDVRALAVAGASLLFVTAHPEGQATALYSLDPEKLTLTEAALPQGGQTLLAVGDDLWIGGTDQVLYNVRVGGAPTGRLSANFAAPIVALAPLANDRLAVACGAQVIVVNRVDRQTSQTLELPDTATCLAADPTGQWLAVGSAKGTVSVFECETASEFRLSDSAPLHEAAVTALLFETDELRFLSAGADQKLLSTHARGRLEPEDRGRGANHTEPITALIAGPRDRFFTGSSDKTLKSWPRGKGARPVTQKDGVGSVVALAVVQVHARPQIVAACTDNTLRYFELDEEAKLGEATVRVHGVDDWAKNELAQSDPKRREAALRKLAGFADFSSLKRITNQMSKDGDHSLRLLACRLLSESAHPRASKALEKGLDHADEAVRVLTFEGLCKHAGPNDLRPLALALKTEKADIGVRAVQALEELAKKDDQSMARLVETLSAKTSEIRRAALTSLENIHGKDSPEASLTALGTPHADLRRLALVRLLQRQLLHDARVQSALRWRGEDEDAEVRRIAFLLSLHTREKLLRALRERDPEIDRQLTELTSGTLPQMEEKRSATKESKPAGKAAAGTPGPLPTALTNMVQQIDAFVAQGIMPAEMAATVRQLVAENAESGKPGLIAQLVAMMRGPLMEQMRRMQKPENK